MGEVLRMVSGPRVVGSRVQASREESSGLHTRVPLFPRRSGIEAEEAYREGLMVRAGSEGHRKGADKAKQKVPRPEAFFHEC